MSSNPSSAAESLDRDWPFAWMHQGMPYAIAPPTSHEQRRLEALSRTDILDSLPEQAYDDLVALASRMCGTPIALISMVDRDRQWFKAKVGLPSSETPRDLAFCAHAILAPDDVFTIHDTQRDPRFVDHPLVTGAPHIRFYAGAPIVTDGEALGTVCVIDTKPRTLDDAQKRSLQILARQAGALLKSRQQAVAAIRQVRRQELLTDEARLMQERGAELLDLVLRGGEFGMWDLHVTSGQWTINAREREILGLDESEATADKVEWRDLVHADDWPALNRALEDHLATGSSHYACALRMRHRQGHWVSILSRAVVVHKNAAGRPIRIVGTHQDITEREDAMQRLEAMARTDTLTGLGTRNYFECRMDELMARTRRASRPGALMSIDIDGFAAINERFGRGGGDDVLRQFAARLRNCLRETDLMARYSGDEFTVALEGLADDRQARNVATEILTGMQLPMRVKDRDLVISACIGLTHFTGIGESVEAVLARADSALRAAKRSQRGGVCTC